ncbi:MAG: DUF488 family protein [Candidatus Magasanikbacteria bacterium]|nr:DUF488 family protein [Candidatus Magasanikbacteria bacterium]
MDEKQLDLLSIKQVQMIPKLEKPPHLRAICSISCSMPARLFFGILKKNQVTMIMDTRRTRDYRGRGFFTSEDDFRYLCKCHDLVYKVVRELSPTREMRATFADEFKFVKKAKDRDPMAWTNFLRSYEDILRSERPLRQGRVHDLLYGEHRVIAIICACQHHEDCHRMLATTMMARYLPGVELKILYPEDKEPRRSYPRRYRLEDFPHFGIQADPPRR